MLGGFCRGSESFHAYVFHNHQILTTGLCTQKSMKTKETDMFPPCPDNSPGTLKHLQSLGQMDTITHGLHATWQIELAWQTSYFLPVHMRPPGSNSSQQVHTCGNSHSLNTDFFVWPDAASCLLSLICLCCLSMEVVSWCKPKCAPTQPA